jgi:DNA-binding CsgD family transcriptional regulator/PAS domain-containing protein
VKLPAEEHLLDVIYGAAVKPSLWSEVLDRLIDIVGADKGGGVLTRMDFETGAGAAVAPTEFDAAAIKEYFDYYSTINPLLLVPDTPSYTAGWTPRIVLDEDWMPRDALEQSEYYNDFLTKIHAEWGMSIRLGLRDTEVASISLGRAFRRGRFEPFEVARAARLQPHLIRAYALSEKFASLSAAAAQPLAGIEDSPCPMIVLDRRGRPIQANAAAETMLCQGDVVTTRDGVLVSANTSYSGPFAGMIARAGHRDWQQRRAASISVPVPHHAAAFTITVSPLSIQQFSAFARAPSVLLSVPDAVSEQPALDKTLARGFSLTPAEARLAVAMLDGQSLSHASAQFGVSINTVRTQLSSLFAKTQTHRQVDLVRCLAQARPPRGDRP